MEKKGKKREAYYIVKTKFAFTFRNFSLAQKLYIKNYEENKNPKRSKSGIVAVYMRKKRFIYIAFILELIVVAFIIGEHHHKDGKIHQDCPICVFSTYTHALFPSIFSITIPIKTVFYSIKEFPIFILNYTPFVIYRPRAPPNNASYAL